MGICSLISHVYGCIKNVSKLIVLDAEHLELISGGSDEAPTDAQRP